MMKILTKSCVPFLLNTGNSCYFYRVSRKVKSGKKKYYKKFVIISTFLYKTSSLRRMINKTHHFYIVDLE